VESSFATPSSRDNRPVTALVQYKDGKKDGLDMSWYENGQKVSEMTWKGGKPTAAQIVWKPNGEKCPVTNVDKNGNGILVHYDEDGTELFRNTLKGGMEVDIQFPE
jgi:antitoxin component YwqK of YwqJK toxin-antitoxin module